MTIAWVFLFVLRAWPVFSQQSLPIHIFAFQKDESKLLLQWFEYHARLVSNTKQIHIIDHFSGDPETQYVLRHIKSRGADVTSFVGPFTEKATELTRLMQKYVHTPSFLVPLDIDEFVVSVNRDNTFGVNTKTIKAAFESLPRDGFKYKFSRIGAFLCNRTAALVRASNSRLLAIRNFGHATADCHSKTFFLSSGFVSTDQGNHRSRVAMDAECSSATPVYQRQCRQCFHVGRGLGIIHYGGEESFTFAEYANKMLRRAAEYNYSFVKRREDCMQVDRGRHYCLFAAKKAQWRPAALQKQFRHRTTCFNRTFISDSMIQTIESISYSNNL